MKDVRFSHLSRVIQFLTLHTHFSKNYCGFIWKQILTKTIDSYAKNSAKHDRRGFESISTQ